MRLKRYFKALLLCEVLTLAFVSQVSASWLIWYWDSTFDCVGVCDEDNNLLVSTSHNVTVDMELAQTCNSPSVTFQAVYPDTGLIYGSLDGVTFFQFMESGQGFGIYSGGVVGEYSSLKLRLKGEVATTKITELEVYCQGDPQENYNNYFYVLVSLIAVDVFLGVAFSISDASKAVLS